MKHAILSLLIMSMAAAPAMAEDLRNQAFEAQVFHTEAGKPMQLAELSAKEMKETEGALIPLGLAALTLSGGEAGAWGNHIHSYAKTGQPASVNSTLKATGAGMVTGASMYGGGRVAYNAITPHTGTIQNWARIGNSYSQTSQVRTVAVRWGSNNHYAKSIGNERIREMNRSFRETKLPGSSWRVQDRGHFHLWKKK